MTEQTTGTIQAVTSDPPVDARRILYVSWAESCSRSDHTARELGGTSHMVYLPWLGSHPLTILPKYFGQFWMTMWLLLRHRPRAVFVMSPPIIASFAAALYGMFTGASFVLDCHTAAFMHPRWKRLQWLQHFLGRRAATNIVTNDHLADLVQQHGGTTTIVRDVPVVYEETDPYKVDAGFYVAAVCSFNPDEPIAELFEAARMLPDVPFYVTGNAKHLSNELIESKPSNIQLTGFVSDAAYGSLLSQAGVVMSLTTRDHTMLRGAWEAIYQSRPVLVSDWPCLREAFSEGAVFTDNSASDIARAVQDCRDRHDSLLVEAERAREKRMEIWSNTRDELLTAIGMEGRQG